MSKNIIQPLVTSHLSLLNEENQILLIGQGYVGKTLAKYFLEYGINVQIWERKTVPYDALDFDFEHHIERTFPTINRLVIINTAGYVGLPNVDACETQKKECFEGNVLFQNRLLLKVAAYSKKKMGESRHILFENIATGCIYNNPIKCGEIGTAFDEWNTPNFGLFNKASFYSTTKHISEEILFSSFTAIEPFMDLNSVRIRIPFDESDSPRSYINKVKKFEYMDDFVNSKTSLDVLFLYLISDIITSYMDVGIYYRKTNVVNSNPLDHSSAFYKIQDTFKTHGISLKAPMFIPSIEVLTPRSNCVLDNTLALQVCREAMGYSNNEYSLDVDVFFDEKNSLVRNINRHFKEKP